MKRKTKNESVYQYYWKPQYSEDDYEPALFNDTVPIKIKKVNPFNTAEDIKFINTYMDFLYENGEVFVDGIWYKNPYLAISQHPGGIVAIKNAIQAGRVCRKLGVYKIY